MAGGRGLERQTTEERRDASARRTAENEFKSPGAPVSPMPTLRRDSKMSQALLGKNRRPGRASKKHEDKRRLLGLILVTGAALTFGVVAACVQAIQLPTLVLQLIRSSIEWLLGLVVAFKYRAQNPEINVEGDEEKLSYQDVLFGPRELYHWLVARAFLYWCFLACWWSALNTMPMGDATAIVYVGPIFTAFFAYLFLGEQIDVAFYPIVCFYFVGVLLICRPSFVFGDTDKKHTGPSGGNYELGALAALTGAVVGGLLPVCTRKSKDCIWIAVTHSSSLLSMTVFTPLAILIWMQVEPTATDSLKSSYEQLFGLDASAEGVLEKWCLVFLTTGLGYVALAMQTLGYQMEEASRASVMTVLEIPFSYALQFFLFGQPISALGLLGAAFIVGATVLNIVRKMQSSDK